MVTTVEIETFYKVIEQPAAAGGTPGHEAAAPGCMFIELTRLAGTALEACTATGPEMESIVLSRNTVSIRLGDHMHLDVVIQAMEFALAVLRQQKRPPSAAPR
ncbi:hypothetical protein [Xylophilus sp.]|uniref:hypothetical protein n=1 Tax=Xylophilus sp. TaxID=2653893 RepID=UPI002D7FE56C|nr:hypothetical protein [Xylophilus sp.]